MSNRLQLVEDEIGRRLKESHESGELSKAQNFGKPLDLGDGYQETPEELRMGYKILKDAGFVPPEVEMMQRIARLREAIAATEAPDQLAALRRQLADTEVSLALAKDRLKGAR